MLSIGLLGLAALLPIGRYTLAEATKADRAGQCGRAALHNVVVRRILDPYPMGPNGQTYAQWLARNTDSDAYQSLNLNGQSSFIIDPRGESNGITAPFGGVVPRVTLGVSPAVRTSGRSYLPAEADHAFLATDDLILPMPEDLKPPQAIGRPQNLDASGVAHPLDYQGAYSWFLTVTPQPNIPTRFVVSVVVCFNRTLTPNASGGATGERAVPVTTFYDSAAINKTAVAIGGGSVYLGTRPINDTPSDETANPSTVAGIALKENDWVALCSPSGLCRWYRVASIGDTNPTDTTQSLTLIGPDWIPTPGKDQLVALGQSVIGVYTTTVDLDTDPTWKN